MGVDRWGKVAMGEGRRSSGGGYIIYMWDRVDVEVE